MPSTGENISTNTGGNYKLGRALPPGGQGTVFLVEGHPLVAKLYHLDRFGSDRLEKQLRHLGDMVKAGQPSETFIWPIDIIENPSPGYIMARVPDDYVSLTRLNLDPSTADLRTRLRVCYRLVDASVTLHQRAGYAYCDLSPSNVLCRASTGAIFIIDNDNLTINGDPSPLNVLGTPRYIACELSSGIIQKPNLETDLHSLAVILFETLLFHHPLLGDRVLDGPQELEDIALSSKPVYIYHPNDKSNRYTKYGQYGGVPIKLLGEDLGKLFAESFIRGVNEPLNRVRQIRWRRALINELDSLIRCSNPGCPFRYSFFTGFKQSTCIWCSRPIIKSKLRLLRFSNGRNKTLRYKVVYSGDWLAAHHCKLDQEFNLSSKQVCAQIVANKRDGLALKNVSSEPFICSPREGNMQIISPGMSIALNPGCRLQFGTQGALAEVMDFHG